MNKEKPILFSTEMVKAILDGRKTQTRRIIKPQPDNRGLRTTNVIYENYHGKEIKHKYQKGDILWVRETTIKIGDKYGYKALLADDEIKQYKFTPSIFMPKEACRIFLEVTNVSVERLQDISVEDAISEGITKLLQSNSQFLTNGKLFLNYLVKKELFNDGLKPVESFQSLWIKINGKESWSNNPWVWKIEFTKM